MHETGKRERSSDGGHCDVHELPLLRSTLASPIRQPLLSQGTTKILFAGVGVGGKCFKFWPLPVIYGYITCLTIQWVFDPKSKNRPTLVESGDFL
ncbi:hypothetical protein CY35_02G150000 [Sphagnum magellanicum]|nr:hypothetical protein CY35_02G150000 [Sphagnum magellanicum]